MRREDPRIEQTASWSSRATLALMAEHGSAAITVERIAERSGVARSTIYRRWPDLPRLYFEAFRQLRSRARTSSPVTSSLDLANYIRDTAAHLNDPTYFSIVIFLMANAAASEHYARLHLELFDLASSRGAAVFRKPASSTAWSGPTPTCGRRPTPFERPSSTPGWPSTNRSTSMSR